MPRFSSGIASRPEPLPLPDYVPRPPGTPAPAHRQPQAAHQSQAHRQVFQKQGAKSSQERLGLASPLPRKRRKQRHGERDKRQPEHGGGYTIDVFGGSAGGGLPSTSYSISDGVIKDQRYKRQQPSMAQPWPNDKHWNSQHYESQELGEDLPYLF